MTASSLNPSWPGTAGDAGTPWVFGHVVALGETARPAANGATVSSEKAGLEWLFKRNCSITPRQMGGFYLSLCVLASTIAVFFMLQGAPFVAAFAGLELLAVGVCLLFFARHIGDRETLVLRGRSLRVELRNGSHLHSTEFTAEWLTVEPAAGQGSLLQLSGEGRSVQVGRFLRPELRPAFARELRRALRRVPVPAQYPTESN